MSQTWDGGLVAAEHDLRGVRFQFGQIRGVIAGKFRVARAVEWREPLAPRPLTPIVGSFHPPT